MHVVNQDRDRIYQFDPAAFIYTTPVVFEGVVYGFNLMMGKAFLGTFDTVETAIKEVSGIFNYKGEIYAVNGYSDWKGGE